MKAEDDVLTPFHQEGDQGRAGRRPREHEVLDTKTICLFGGIDGEENSVDL